jgi:hemerythrin
MDEFMVFGSSLKLHIFEVDEEHRELVSRINRIAASAGLHALWHSQPNREQPSIDCTLISTLLNDLDSKVHDHFASEEAFMQEARYHDLEEHKREHLMLQAELKGFTQAVCKGEERVDTDAIIALKHWLIGHIIGADKEFAKFYHARNPWLRMPAVSVQQQASSLVKEGFRQTY